jgi:hypothetical protein
MSYIVVQEAVYHHGIAGPFDTLEDAVAFADRAASDDYDDHHRYCVYEAGPFWVVAPSLWHADPRHNSFEGMSVLYEAQSEKTPAWRRARGQ